MLETFEVNKVLIIAPLRVARDTWPAEIEKWDHLKGLDISVIVGDEGDVVIDPCAGSGSTLRAARELGRNSYGFEVSRDFYQKANEQMLGEEASA